MDRRTSIREGISALRHLRSLARLGSVTPRDLDRLLGKIEAGLETGLDCQQMLPPPAAGADFAETQARLAAAGLRVVTGAMLLAESHKSLLDWSASTATTAESERCSDDFAADWDQAVFHAFGPEACRTGPTRMRTVGHLGVIDGDRK